MKCTIYNINGYIKELKKYNLTEGTFTDNTEIKIDNNPFIIINNCKIHLSKLKCNYGNYRYYFICPYCGMRKTKLNTLENGVIPLCVKCLNIDKFTLNRTKTDPCYYWELAVKECKKIDPKHKQDDYIHFIFPDRPKYMRYKKYLKHYRKFSYYVDMGNAIWLRG